MADVPPGLAAVLPALECPHCGTAFDPDGGTLICVGGHTFDVARQGYITLLAGNAGGLTADDADMIAARERFFATGRYERFHAAVAAAAARAPVGLGPILDCGAGEGEYLARAVAERGGTGIGLDLSKPGARRTARRGPSIGSVVANGWDRLPWPMVPWAWCSRSSRRATPASSRACSRPAVSSSCSRRPRGTCASWSARWG